MFGKLRNSFKQKERAFRTSFGRDITDPDERRKSLWHFNWLDHGILRKHWHNFQQIAPSVYRSNHPDPKRFQRYAKMGIKSILNLRGSAPQSHYLFEVESCTQLGLHLVDIKTWSFSVVVFNDGHAAYPADFFRCLQFGAHAPG